MGGGAESFVYLILYNHLQYPPRWEREGISSFSSLSLHILLLGEREDWATLAGERASWTFSSSFARLQQFRSRLRPSSSSPCDLSFPSSIPPVLSSAIRPSGQSILRTSPSHLVPSSPLTARSTCASVDCSRPSSAASGTLADSRWCRSRPCGQNRVRVRQGKSGCLRCTSGRPT